MTAPGLRERKKARTRLELQQAAFRLIDRQGYQATTIEQIAAAADVSPSTFFRYFRTKEDVVVDSQDYPILVAALAPPRAGLPPFEATRAAVRDTFHNISADDRAILFRRLRLAHMVPVLRARRMDGIGTAHGLFTASLAGRLHRSDDDFEIRVIVATMIAALTAALQVWVAGGGTQDLGQLVDHALALLPNELDPAPTSGRHAVR